MKRIVVIDGQGGGFGRTLIAALRAAGVQEDIIAVGTNSAATSAMLKAGATAGATGENAALVNAARADILAGPIGLVMANSMLGVLLVAIAFRIPGSSFIIKNFFDGIPRDIENSTLVDGCSRVSAFFQVIIYLVKPGIASISVFSFLSAWSNYILFNTLIFNSKTPVFATYLRSLSSNEQMIASYGVFAAMALVYMLPVIVFFLISQRSLMEGNIASGKGV